MRLKAARNSRNPEIFVLTFQGKCAYSQLTDLVPWYGEGERRSELDKAMQRFGYIQLFIFAIIGLVQTLTLLAGAIRELVSAAIGS